MARSMKRLNLDVEDELFSDFKSHCATKGRTIREEITELISTRLETETEEVPESSEEESIIHVGSKQTTLSTLDKVNENVMTLGANLEAQGHAITDLRSEYHSLRIDRQVDKAEVECIKEIVGTHAQRLDEVEKDLETLHALRPITSENKARVAKVEVHLNDLEVRLNDEKRQRKESDSNLWRLIGVGAFLCLLNSLPPTQATPPLKPQVRDPIAAANAYITAKMAAKRPKRY